MYELPENDAGTTAASTPKYDPDTTTYYAKHTPEDDNPLSTAIICALMEIDERDVSDLEPLANVVDVDSLDRMFEAPSSEPDAGNVELRFEYDGYDVHVSQGGLIAVTPLHGRECGR